MVVSFIARAPWRGPTVSTRRVGIYALISSSGTQMMGPHNVFAVPYAECHTFLTGVGGQLTVCLINTTTYLHLIQDQHLGDRGRQSDWGERLTCARHHLCDNLTTYGSGLHASINGGIRSDMHVWHVCVS